MCRLRPGQASPLHTDTEGAPAKEEAVYVPAWAGICPAHGGACHRFGSAPEGEMAVVEEEEEEV